MPDDLGTPVNPKPEEAGGAPSGRNPDEIALDLMKFVAVTTGTTSLSAAGTASTSVTGTLSAALGQTVFASTGTGGVDQALPVEPSARTLNVATELRTYSVAAETRTYSVAA